MRKGLLLFLVLSLIGPLAEAQTMTRSKERHVNGLILELLEDYEQSVLLYDSGAKRSFLRLFDDREAGIYCDFLESQHLGEVVSISDYADYALGNVLNTMVEIQDVTKDRPRYTGGAWHWNVSFRKNVRYTDPHEIYFSSSEFIEGGCFLLTMDVVYDEAEDRCFIHSIEGKTDGKAFIPKGKFLVIQETPGSRDSLLVNGKHPSFNRFGQAIVNNGKVSPGNEDIFLKQKVLASTDRYDYVEYQFRSKNWRFRPRFATTLGSAFHVTSSDNVVSYHSHAMEYGADLGIAFIHGKRIAVSFNIGAALSTSSIELAANNINYSMEILDADRQSYRRSYHILTAIEGIKYQDWVVPAYFSIEAQLMRYVKLLLDIGGNGYVHWKTQINPYHVRGTVEGTSRKATYNDINQDFTRFMEPGSYARKRPYDFTAMARLGVDVKLYGPLFVYGKIGYEYGFKDIYSPSSEEASWMNEGDGIYPIVYNAVKDEEVATHSFIHCISLSRRALWLDAGLLIKF
jgi:hypothetical protein